jgi:hypothetical protein
MTATAPLVVVLRKTNAYRIEVCKSGNAAPERTWGALEDYITWLYPVGRAVEKDKE